MGPDLSNFGLSGEDASPAAGSLWSLLDEIPSPPTGDTASVEQLNLLLRIPLYQFQASSVHRMLDIETRRENEYRQRGGVLCEDMGSGKSAICIGLIMLTRGHVTRAPTGHRTRRDWLPARSLAVQQTTNGALPWSNSDGDGSNSGDEDLCLCGGFVIEDSPPCADCNRPYHPECADAFLSRVDVDGRRVACRAPQPMCHGCRERRRDANFRLESLAAFVLQCEGYRHVPDDMRPFVDAAVTSAVGLTLPFYVTNEHWEPPSGLRASRSRLPEHMEMRVILSAATLLIVPAGLMGQWQQQFNKFCPDGSIKIHTIVRPSEVPKQEDLALVDVAIISHECISAFGIHLWPRRTFPVHSVRLSSPSQSPLDACTCAECTPCLGTCPLLGVRWQRVMVDEGAKLGHIGAPTNLKSFVGKLPADALWVISGTPLVGRNVETDLHRIRSLLSFVGREPFAVVRGRSWTSRWTKEIVAPIVAVQRLKKRRALAIASKRESQASRDIASESIGMSSVNVTASEKHVRTNDASRDHAPPHAKSGGWTGESFRSALPDCGGALDAMDGDLHPRTTTTTTTTTVSVAAGVESDADGSMEGSMCALMDISMAGEPDEATDSTVVHDTDTTSHLPIVSLDSCDSNATVFDAVGVCRHGESVLSGSPPPGSGVDLLHPAVYGHAHVTAADSQIGSTNVDSVSGNGKSGESGESGESEDIIVVDDEDAMGAGDDLKEMDVEDAHPGYRAACRRLKTILADSFVRHSVKEVYDEAQLPPLTIAVIRLPMAPHERQLYNEVAAQVITNTITSQKEGKDYILHQDNLKHALNAVFNLQQACFFHEALSPQERDLGCEAIEKYISDHATNPAEQENIRTLATPMHIFRSHPIVRFDALDCYSMLGAPSVVDTPEIDAFLRRDVSAYGMGMVLWGDGRLLVSSWLWPLIAHRVFAENAKPDALTVRNALTVATGYLDNCTPQSGDSKPDDSEVPCTDVATSFASRPEAGASSTDSALSYPQNNTEENEHPGELSVGAPVARPKRQRADDDTADGGNEDSGVSTKRKRVRFEVPDGAHQGDTMPDSTMPDSSHPSNNEAPERNGSPKKGKGKAIAAEIGKGKAAVAEKGKGKGAADGDTYAAILFKNACVHWSYRLSSHAEFSSLVTSSTKLNYVLSRIRAVIGDEKSIVFSQRHETLQYVMDALNLLGIKHVQYVTYMKPSQRSSALTTFATSDDCRVIVMDSIRAAVGLDVKAASRIFYLDPLWDIAKEKQAFKRSHRIGQTRHVHVEKIVMADTIEEVIAGTSDAGKAFAEIGNTARVEDIVTDKAIEQRRLHAIVSAIRFI